MIVLAMHLWPVGYPVDPGIKEAFRSHDGVPQWLLQIVDTYGHSIFFTFRSPETTVIGAC